jgi:hypothetical protein
LFEEMFNELFKVKQELVLYCDCKVGKLNVPPFGENPKTSIFVTWPR